MNWSGAAGRTLIGAGVGGVMGVGYNVAANWNNPDPSLMGGIGRALGGAMMGAAAGRYGGAAYMGMRSALGGASIWANKGVAAQGAYAGLAGRALLDSNQAWGKIKGLHGSAAAWWKNRPAIFARGAGV